jgi:hypothetical protein
MFGCSISTGQEEDSQALEVDLVRSTFFLLKRDITHMKALDCTPMTGQIRLGESGGGGHYPPE